jgi:peptidoglycan/LPS O-acetylase OafA/YrhL
MRLSEAFDARANSLNALRLVLACGVILFHSFEVTGNHIEWWPLRQFMQSVWVDGFFAISGFLIVRSWMRRPDAMAFIRARTLRILPGFYVCLILTALVFALLAGLNPLSVLPDGLSYVVKNAGLYILQTGIAGTPEDVPYAGYWNVSLWTLAWEVACYVGVLGAGLVGLLRKSWTLPVMAAGAWLLSAAGVAGLHHSAPVSQGARFALVFLMGSLIYQFADKVPASWVSVAGSGAVILGSMWLPDYRLVAGPLVAHVALVIGSKVYRPWLNFRNDLSYGAYIYGFPVQQLLVLGGLGSLAIPAFFALTLALTLAFAAGSWFLIEKNALHWKAPSPKRSRGLSPVRA